MSTNPTLTVSVNGGPPLTGAVYVDDGDTLDFSVLNRDGWLRARWEMTDYPEGFPCPSGWSTASDDVTRPTYYFAGTANPPTVTSNGWGPYKSRVIVNDVDVDERTFVKILSPSGFEAQAADEEGQFGGTKLQKDKAYNANLQLIEDYSAALAISDVDPTPDTILKRGPSGEGKCVSFQGASIASTTTSFTARNSAADGFDVSNTTATVHHSAAVALTAGTTITAAATTSVSVTSGTTCTVTASGLLTLSGGAGAALKTTTGGIDLNAKNGSINLQKDSTTAVVCSVDPVGAVSIAPVAGATSVTYQQTQATSGIGKNAVFAAQRGFAGSVGGVSVLGASNGGTGGTNLAGGVALELGQLVSNVSAKAAFWANGSEIGYAQKLASAEFALASAASHDLSLEAATGSLRLKVGGSNSVVWTLSASGAVTLAPVGGAASLTIQPSQKTSGAGAAVVVAGGQGSSGNVGGKTTVGADNGATPGTNLGGGVRVQLGQTVTGVSSAFDIYAGATELVAINSNASYRYQQKTTGGTAGYQAQSGVIVGSNDDTVRAYFNQGGGTVAITGTNGAVRLQDTNVTWCEVARVAASRNVVGLCVGANLDTTKMPANTGNGVLFVGNAGTPPTAVPNSTGCGLYSEATQLRSFASTNDWEGITSLVGTGYTKTIKDRSVDDAATTSSTAIFTAGTIRAGYMTGLTGAGSAVVVVKGYRAGDVIVHRRLVNFSVVAGVPAVLNSSTLGTDTGAATTIAFDISTDLRVRVTPPDSTSTKWSCTIDWEFEAVT